MKQNRKARKAAKMYHVAIYHCYQSYGGPEEGGWWYTTGEHVKFVGRFARKSSAYECMRSIVPDLDAMNAGKPPFHSVLSDGQFQARVHKGQSPSYFPLAKPHYE